MIQVGEPVIGMVFGAYSRDDGVLILNTQSGRLHFKILKRTAAFTTTGQNSGPPKEQAVNIPVPSKSKM